MAYSNNVGESFYVTVNHGKNSNKANKVSWSSNPPLTYNSVTQNGDDLVFTHDVAGVYAVTVEVDYGNGNICSTDLSLVWEDVLAVCGGDQAGGEGQASFNYPNITKSGVFYIEYDFKGNIDKMEVYAGGTLIHDTGSQTYSSGSPFGFNYDPVVDGLLEIIMNDGQTGSLWEYRMYCPGEAPNEIQGVALADVTIVNP